MSQPEKTPQQHTSADPLASEKSPKLDAIIPDHLPLSSSEMLGQFDDYQKRLESEWERTKEAYHDKIDRMMEDFLKDTLPKAISETPESTTAPKKESVFDRMHQESIGLSKRLESVLTQAEKNLLTAKRTPGSSLGFPLEHASVKKNSFWMFATIAVFSAAFFVMAFLNNGHLTSLPYLHTVGPQQHGSHVYVVDWFRKALFVHNPDRNMQIISVENMPNAFTTGFVMTDKYLWSVDGFNRKILQHALTTEHEVLREYPAPGKKPVGLSMDNGKLWIGDADSRVLTKLEGVDPEEILDQYQLPELTLTAFQVQGPHVWVLNGKSREVLQFRIQETPKLINTIDLDAFLKGENPTGLLINEKNVLITTEDSSKIYTLSKSKFLAKK